jgi:kynurenine formamidase
MSKHILDLSQSLYDGMADWDGCCGFQMKTVIDYNDGLCVQGLRTPNGIGTHMDAPSHFFKDASDIASIPLEQCFCPGVMIDLSHKAGPDYSISLDDIVSFEKEHGPIAPQSLVIANTGWGKHWHTAKDYRNEDAQGMMHFPRFSLQAAKHLLSRNIHGIAIDTLSPDGCDLTFPVHHALLRNNVFIIENIRIDPQLPAMGAMILALPIKINNASEAPCRVIAFVDQ